MWQDEDGSAYVVYSSNGNKDLHIGRLSRDYTNVAGDFRKAIVGSSREAPALFRHADQYFHTAGYAAACPSCDAVLVFQQR